MRDSDPNEWEIDAMMTESRANSFAVEVIADSYGTWVGNGMRYATHADAEASARDLASRWTLVTAWRVVPSDDAPNALEPVIRGAGHRVKLV